MTSAVATIPAAASAEGRKVVRDGLIVTLGGQLQRIVGTLTALALRWGLDPSRMGVYSGLRVALDQTNRTSLGVGLGAVQEIPILRSQGRFDEAAHVAAVANTANTLTSGLYAVAMLAVAGCWVLRPSGPLALEWAGGLVAMSALALLHRRLSFHVAVLRANQEFAATTELEVLEGFASALLVIPALWLAGFWGLLVAIALLMAVKLAYLHARHPLRIGQAWDWAVVGRLMRVGLPIFLSTASFAALSSLDRILILGHLPDGERALGLYSIALLGTNWTLDAAGRIGMVLYPHFQSTLGRTGDPAAVALAAARAVELQVPLITTGAAMTYLVAPTCLGTLMPRYVEGLPALRPLVPGMLLLALAWPARQALVTVGRPYLLSGLAAVGIVVAAVAGWVGTSRAGLVGVSWAMTAGYATVFALTSLAALRAALGWRGWLRHLARVLAWSCWALAGAGIADATPWNLGDSWSDLAGRAAVLAAWVLPALGAWAHRQGWWHHVRSRSML